MEDGSARSIAEAAPIILKIGGSLLTHRGQSCTLNWPRIRDYVDAIRTNWQALAGRLILILGGGSFGHDVVRRYGLQHGESGCRPEDRQALTVSLLELKLTLSRELRLAGVPCFPFHTSSLVVTRDHEIASRHPEGVLAAVAGGILPVCSGDLVFDHCHGFVLFSSDRVPELFLGRVDIARVVVLTDVPGILDRHGQLIEHVGDDNWRDVWGATGVSAKPDVTGGMRAKFEAVLKAAHLGIECVIADGSNATRGMAAVLQPCPPGTMVRLGATAIEAK